MRWLVAEDDGGPRGYALYSVRRDWGPDGIPARGCASELMAVTSGHRRAVDRPADQGPDRRGARRPRPVDDPLLPMLAGRRRARASLTDSLWVRLVDVPGHSASDGTPAPWTSSSRSPTTMLPANAGRWRLRAAADGTATCERRLAAELLMPVNALGAAYLGGTRLGTLAAAGQVAEKRPGALAELSAAMSWDPAPWAPMTF